MRAYLIGALTTLVLAGSAVAGSSECSRTLDGGWRCKEPDGHVTERRPDGEGGARTTSTDPRKWGTTDGHGRGITPPDSMIRNSPILRREAWVQQQSEGLLARLFGGRVAPLVAHFSERGQLTPADIAELKRLVSELDDGKEADDGR